MCKNAGLINKKQISPEQNIWDHVESVELVEKILKSKDRGLTTWTKEENLESGLEKGDHISAKLIERNRQ